MCCALPTGAFQASGMNFPESYLKINSGFEEANPMLSPAPADQANVCLCAWTSLSHLSASSDLESQVLLTLFYSCLASLYASS